MTDEKLLKKLKLYSILHGNKTITDCQKTSCRHFQFGRCFFKGYRRYFYYQSHDGGKTIGTIDGVYDETHKPKFIYFGSCIEFLNKDNK
jgi:hypothetical protein